MALAERDLTASRTPCLDTDWRLNIAYNAALQLATAALAASGYRANRQAHHYYVIQSLAHTIGADTALVEQLQQFRRKRHHGAYDRAGLVSSTEAEAMGTLATELRSLVLAWLHDHHPELMSP